MSAHQIGFDFPLLAPPALGAAVEALATASAAQERGAVFTRTEVVDFILDLVGYTADKPLMSKRLLEPAFGGGSFLVRVVPRLLEAWRRNGSSDQELDQLGDTIRAVELHRATFDGTRAKLLALLSDAQISRGRATALVNQWLIRDDFLLTTLESDFDFVVGNPPYVRQELIPAALLAEYRLRYPTMTDRADLYIPFIERSLRVLARGGQLGFICADRWMKNRYGAALRRLIAQRFHLKCYVDMVDTPAFDAEVSTYPAITIIERAPPGPTRIAHRPSLDRATLRALARSLTAPPTDSPRPEVRELPRVTNGAEPWLIDAPGPLAIVRRLEARFPTLEEAGCKVGIGVATGADKAFIGPFESLDVEADRKLPLVTTKDLNSGEVRWQGLGVVNPFEDDGRLVKLDEFPRLARYLEARREVIARRHCARKNPAQWYRTIDRITPSLASTPKLLIPDIKGSAHIVYEDGHFYPHHNLYYVTSAGWELRALQGVLLSAVARLFVESYSVKMRGGYLRFQAQYVRRIRLPRWSSVPIALREALATAARERDLQACDHAAFDLFGLSDEERDLLMDKGNA